LILNNKNKKVMKLQSKIQSKIPKFNSTNLGGNMRHYFCINQFNSDYKQSKKNTILRMALEKALNGDCFNEDDKKHIEAERFELQTKIDYFKNHYYPVLEWLRINKMDLSSYSDIIILEKIWEKRVIESTTFSELMNMKNEIRLKNRF